jgi:hypothetical protein
MKSLERVCSQRPERGHATAAGMAGVGGWGALAGRGEAGSGEPELLAP